MYFIGSGVRGSDQYWGRPTSHGYFVVIRISWHGLLLVVAEYYWPTRCRNVNLFHFLLEMIIGRCTGRQRREGYGRLVGGQAESDRRRNDQVFENG